MRKPDWCGLWQNICCRDPEPVALLIAVLEIAWGMWVATDWGTTLALYWGLNGDVMGFYMAVTGLVMILAMLWNLHRIYAIALISGFAGWTYIALSGGVGSEWRGVSVVLYGMLALCTLWVWIRLRWDDARLKDIDDDEGPTTWKDSLRLW